MVMLQYYLDRPVFELPSLNFYWERFFFIYKIKKRKLLNPEYNILPTAWRSAHLFGFKLASPFPEDELRAEGGINSAPPLFSHSFTSPSGGGGGGGERKWTEPGGWERAIKMSDPTFGRNKKVNSFSRNQS
uniref:Uncharacterized protein n=1 Tax=Morchella brunnea TaxID=1174671 RepID=A0A8K1I7N5_9PEZI|nr:hypothetical protein LK370_mgp013 [Morchella brunnea]UBU98413.1 hypothetical protein [Morchella brunnea]